MAHDRGPWIQTFTGRQFFPLDPQSDEICIEDIAHALANTCRFNGHVRKFYSVAEHSVFVALNVPLQFRPAALLHDASEAYICDLPRPIKHNVVGYKEAEDKVMAAIFAKFNLKLPLPKIVKEVDNRILFDERDTLMGDPPAPWDFEADPLGVQLRAWLPEDAEQAFLQVWYGLGTQGYRA